jgi:hypothetical protein
MTDYRFSLIIPTAAMTEERILDVTDAVGDAGVHPRTCDEHHKNH